MVKLQNKLLFLLFSLLNYAIIPVSYFAAIGAMYIPFPGTLYLLSLGLHMGLAFVNAKVATNYFEYIVLSVHLFLATAISYPSWMMIRYASSAFVDVIPVGILIGLLGSVGCSFFSFFRHRKTFEKNKNSWKNILVDILISVMILGIMSAAVFVTVQPQQLTIKNEGKAVLHCRHDGNVLPEADLSDSDRQKIVDLLDKHMLCFEIPRQPRFHDDYSVQIGNEWFLIGEDNSGIIKYKTRYFHLSTEETKVFFELLNQYGMK